MLARQLVIAAVTLIVGLAAMLIPLPFGAPAAQARAVDVTARQFAFEPAIVRVPLGATVHLHFESLDSAHGLFVDGYPVDIQAEPGRSAEVTFTAGEAGKFKIRCSIPCGPLHPFMTGELQVEPELPLARALATMMVVAIGAVAFFWNR